MNCLQCHKETKNPKFCCQSCSATYNNTMFPKRTKKTDNEPQRCSECNILSTPENSYRQRKTLSRRCKSCQTAFYREYNNQIKRDLVAMCGGKCCKCGYDKNFAALHFHHRDPLQKEFEIATNSFRYETIAAEVEKCDLVCANCHAEEHYPSQNNPHSAAI